MNFSPFSCPIFLGHTEARGRCSQGERVLYGRDLWRSGGTGKAEPTKLPGAGIGPKQSRENVRQKKVEIPKSVKSRRRGPEGVRSYHRGRRRQDWRTRWGRKERLTLDYTPGCSVW